LKIRGGNLSRYTEKLLPLYNAKKDLPNPPSYLKDLKELLTCDGLINENEGDGSV
jgi:hypothetical protein